MRPERPRAIVPIPGSSLLIIAGEAGLACLRMAPDPPRTGAMTHKSGNRGRPACPNAPEWPISRILAGVGVSTHIGNNSHGDAVPGVDGTRQSRNPEENDLSESAKGEGGPENGQIRVLPAIKSRGGAAGPVAKGEFRTLSHAASIWTFWNRADGVIRRIDLSHERR